MSSPIAGKGKGALSEALISAHRQLSHNHRIEILARQIAAMIGERHPTGKVLCLDVGCGDMALAERIAELAPATRWRCVDIYPLPVHLVDDPRWEKYQWFDGVNIPCPDDSFDLVLFCDVLHHVQHDADALVAEAGRVARTVLVKDHLEYSWFSRLALWGMDFLGNWGYGVPLPRRYFTRERFVKLVEAVGLGLDSLTVGLRLYDHLPVLRRLLRPKWQFLAVLSRK